MIDIERENLVLLSRASALVPGRPHASTLIRWALRGIRGRKLETVIVGGRRYTSVEAVRRFVEHGNAPDILAPSAQRQRQVRDAERMLDLHGIRVTNDPSAAHK